MSVKCWQHALKFAEPCNPLRIKANGSPVNVKSFFLIADIGRILRACQTIISRFG